MEREYSKKICFLRITMLKSVIMKRNRINAERVVSVVGFLFLLAATILGIYLNGDEKSIIEKVADTSIVIPVVHGICALIIFISIFIQKDILIITVLLIESTLTILTKYEQLGIFFFYAVILLILCKGSHTRKNKISISILFCIHFITILLTYTHGWHHTFIDLGNSLLCMVFYFWIYILMKEKMSACLPKNIVENEIIINKEPGAVINLSEYNLNERQRTFVLANLNDNLSYSEISEKYFVSVSTVKKVFAEVFRIFNVSKLDELRILLRRYKVIE